MAKTMYCDKCGKTWIIFPPYTDISIICDICGNTIKPVPSEYFENLSNEGLLLSKEMKQKLLNDLVLTSPNFDQYYFDHKEDIKEQQYREYSEKMAHGKAILEEKIRVAKCPSCGSANVSKIGTIDRMVSTGLLGLASSKIGKTHKCNNCGTTW